jgi:hypothetical protein
MTVDPEVTVRSLLAAAGLEPSEEEIGRIAAVYPLLRADLDSLYGVPDTRYEATAQTFSATIVTADWREGGKEKGATPPSGMR